jgi:hypothetical protein
MPAYQNNKTIYIELPSGSKAEIALFGIKTYKHHYLILTCFK